MTPKCCRCTECQLYQLRTVVDWARSQRGPFSLREFSRRTRITRGAAGRAAALKILNALADAGELRRVPELERDRRSYYFQREEAA